MTLLVNASAHGIGISSAAVQVFFVLGTLVFIRMLTKFTLSENWTFSRSVPYKIFTKIHETYQFVMSVLSKDLRVSLRSQATLFSS
ncbi:MAG TPA: hypothetical protein VJJ82_01125 [Candidatus Nanoarchaeia archaeon]|nr:hypothetical protein [Candidatus Nanoarchaeia archaeon]